MTYYLIHAEPISYQYYREQYCPVGDDCYTWTTNNSTLLMFMKEYHNYADINVEEFECDSIREFKDVVMDEHSVEINPFNELYVQYSEFDQNNYHVTASSIDDENGIGGISDIQYQTMIQTIIRSSLNILKLCKYVTQPDINRFVRCVIYKYLTKIILLDNGISLDDVSKNVLDTVGITEEDTQDGIFSVVDEILFEKASMGMEI